MFYYVLVFFLIVLYPVCCSSKFYFSKFHGVGINFTRGKGLYCLIVSVILILLAGLRGLTVGRDTDQYMLLYNSVKNSYNIVEVLKNANEEVGYVLLEYVVSRFGVGYQVFLMVCSFLTVAPAGYVIYRYSKLPWLSFVVFLSFPVYTTLGFSALRQGIAFGMLMFAFHFSQKENLKYYLLFVAAAFCFHMSAVIFLPVYWIRKFNFSTWVVGISIGLIVLGVVFKSVLFSFLNSYSRQEYSSLEAGGTNMYLFFLALVCFSFFYRKYAISVLEANKIYVYLMIITVVLWPMASTNPAIFRLTYYFNFFLALFVSNFMTSIQPKVIRYVCIVGICLVCIYSIGYLVMRPERLCYPYFFYWENDSAMWFELDNL